MSIIKLRRRSRIGLRIYGGCWISVPTVFLLATFIALSAASPVLATRAAPQDTATSPDAHLWKQTSSDFGAFFTAPIHWKGRQWGHLALGLTAVAVAASFDGSVRSSVQDNRSPQRDRIANIIRPAGGALPLAAFATFWIAGRSGHHNAATSLGFDGLEASVLAAGIVTPAIKITTGRARPFQEEGPRSFDPFGGNQSFPSGEVTEAFAAAAVVSGHTHSPWIRAGVWGTAGLVGLERMNFDSHWLSDVVAAAMIGASTGHFVVHRHRHPAGTSPDPEMHPDPKVMVVPLAANAGRGLLVDIVF